MIFKTDRLLLGDIWETSRPRFVKIVWWFLLSDCMPFTFSIYFGGRMTFYCVCYIFRKKLYTRRCLDRRVFLYYRFIFPMRCNNGWVIPDCINYCPINVDKRRPRAFCRIKLVRDHEIVSSSCEILLLIITFSRMYQKDTK